MRFIKNLVSSLVLVAAIGVFGPAKAQMDLGTSMGDLDYMPVIFLNKKVADDMHLSPAAQQKETQVIMQGGMSLMGAMGGGKSPNPKAGTQAMAGLKKMQDESLAPLTPAQRVRYHQLSLQYFGPSALISPKVAHKLGLTSAQTKRLSDSIVASSKGMAASLGAAKSSASSDPMAAMKNMRASLARARAAQTKSAKMILTPSQWSQWEALQGKKLPGIEDPFGGLMGE